MEFEDFGARFSVAVEDYSESWPLLQETLQGRGPLRHVTLRNKFGNPVPITELPIQFLLSSDSKLQNIKPFQGSPVTWFRNPYARLILVSGEDADDYKKTVRGQLKALLEKEKDPLGPTNWVVCYIKPAASDPLSKGPRKVFDALRYDFDTRKRERCVRLDFPVQQGQGSIAGLEELEQLLKAAVKTSFETRAAAYEEEVRKLMARRLEPGWNFSTLYLIKDSLAIMLEAAGLLEDAFREYFELEACYLEALKQGGNLAGRQFGGKTDGDDVAQILKAAWRETRSSVMRGNGVAEFYFRQYLFACQARLLFKLNRPTEVAERGLQFVHTFAHLLADQQAASVVPGLFREAWAFSACISLATTTSRLMGATTVLNKKPPEQPATPVITQQHRRSASVHEDEAQEANRHLSISHSANDLAQRHDARQSTDGATHHRSTVDTAELQQAPDLKPLKINKNNFAGLEAQGVIAQLSLPEGSPKDGLSGMGGGTPTMHMEVDWDLGVSGHSDDLPEEEEEAVLWSRTPSSSRKPPIPNQAYYCLLGHLYAAARLELMRMGETLHLSQHTPAGPVHGNGASPMASRLSSQHASHSSTPAHTFSSVGPAAAATSSVSKPEQQASQQNGGVQVLQEAAPSTDLGTASSLSAAITGSSGRRPQLLHTTSSKKLSRFAVESQRLQPPAEGLPPLAPPTPMATRGDSVTSQISAGPGASPSRTTTDD
ncbi:MAG: TRAPPII tethering factor, partial [Trebouxia sp. A1-2]